MGLYKCSPKKNKNCRGRHTEICQRDCFITLSPENSTDGVELTEEEVDRFIEEKVYRKRRRRDEQEGGERK